MPGVLPNYTRCTHVKFQWEKIRISNEGISKFENNEYFETTRSLKNSFMTISNKYDVYFEINFENRDFKNATRVTYCQVVGKPTFLTASGCSRKGRSKAVAREAVAKGAGF
jgi:hypothetical protein